MAVSLVLMLFASTFIFAITFKVHGLQTYDSRSIDRKFNIMSMKQQVMNMELQDLKAGLNAEKDKSTRLEKNLESLKVECGALTGGNKDIELTGSASREHQYQDTTESNTFKEIVYKVLMDNKKIRKQFENQMKNDYKTEKENMDFKFNTLEEKLSAVIDTKLETADDKVTNATANLNVMIITATDVIFDNIMFLNKSIASMDLTNTKVRNNGEALTSVMAYFKQVNETLVKQKEIIDTVTDTFVDIKIVVENLRNTSHRYKVCLNGGKHLVGGLCECPSPYYGTHCEKVCLNGGKTSDGGICECPSPYYGTQCENKVVYSGDCNDINQQTNQPTGLYYIKPRGFSEAIKVKCDMETDGGGWTVFQYRYDGSEEFFRNFTDYENGFGSLKGEFWLGLRYIQLMTTLYPTVLRIDLKAADGETAYALYQDFYLSEPTNYTLNIGTYSGTAGDSNSLPYNKGRSFSTFDNDVDNNESKNCAVADHAGWWHNNCAYANLNGQYETPGTKSELNTGEGGMTYRSFKGFESLQSSKLMFRRK